jgi:hypothetical protein
LKKAAAQGQAHAEFYLGGCTTTGTVYHGTLFKRTCGST